MNRIVPLAVLAVSVLAALPLADDALAQSIGTLADIVKTAETKSTTFGQLPPVSPGTSTIEMTFKRVVDGVDSNTFLIDGMPTTDADCRDEVWTFTIAKAIRPDATPTISIRSGQSFTSGGPSGCEFPPGAGTGLMATGGTPNHTAVSLSWTAPTDPGTDPITDYIVQYKKSSDTNWLNDTRTTSPRTTTSEDVTGLESNTGYDFRVAAINLIGIGEYISTIRSTTPAAPTGLAASSGSPSYSTMSLGWTAPIGGDQTITNYAVYYKNSTSSWTLFNDGPSATAGESVTGLTNGTAYQFKVAAVNNAGAGANTTSTSESTGAAVAPEPPVNLLANSNSGTSVLVTWDRPIYNTTTTGDGGSPITGYSIQYRVDGASSWTNSTTSTTTSKIVTGLNGSTWNFQVAAVNGVGTGSYFAGDSANNDKFCRDPANNPPALPRHCYDLGSEKPSSKPGVPTGLDVVDIVNGRPKVTWDAPPSGVSVDQYWISSYSASHGQAWGGYRVYTTENVYTGDPANSEAISIRAHGGGWGDKRSPLVAWLSSARAPGPVDGLAASSASTTSVSLEWKKPFSGGAAITDYNIYHRIGESGIWTQYADGTSTNTNSTISSLPYGTQYQIKVAAVNSAGEGTNSTAITYTTGLR